MITIEPSSKTTILFLSWRDIRSPKHGGAEVYTHEMMARADHDRFRFIHIAPTFEGGADREVIDGVEYLRMGTGGLSVIVEARKFYKHNASRIDFVVDQCNTHRFFTKLWVPADKRIFFIHQLTREIWHLNAKPPISTVGAITETPFLRLSKNDPTITVSPSTRRDLLDVGFDPNKVVIVPEGLDFEAWDTSAFLPKEEHPTFVYVGRFVHYKGIDDSVLAFSRLREKHPEARLWIVGRTNEDYLNEVLKPILDRNHLTYGFEEGAGDVVFHGFVSDERKLELMSRAHALLFPSQREGWGLIVTEAAVVGTPSIGYDSPGIVDALDEGRAGYLCETNTVGALAREMNRVIDDPEEYQAMRQSAYDFARQFHWDKTAAAFNDFMDRLDRGARAGITGGTS
jgi:glycosyltransferase involved in cell wall biosynthesis